MARGYKPVNMNKVRLQGRDLAKVRASQRRTAKRAAKRGVSVDEYVTETRHASGLHPSYKGKVLSSAKNEAKLEEARARADIAKRKGPEFTKMAERQHEIELEKTRNAGKAGTIAAASGGLSAAAYAVTRGREDEKNRSDVANQKAIETIFGRSTMQGLTNGKNQSDDITGLYKGVE